MFKRFIQQCLKNFGLQGPNGSQGPNSKFCSQGLNKEEIVLDSQGSCTFSKQSVDGLRCRSLAYRQKQQTQNKRRRTAGIVNKINKFVTFSFWTWTLAWTLPFIVRSVKTTNMPRRKRPTLRESVKKDFDFDNFVPESGETWNDLKKTVTNFIHTVTPVEIHNTFLVTSLVSALITFFLSLFSYTKKKTALGTGILISSFITLVANILCLCKVPDDISTQLIETITEDSSFVLDVKPTIRHPRYYQDGQFCDESRLVPVEVDFLSTLYTYDDVTPQLINKIGKNIRDLILPSNNAPAFNPIFIRKQWEDFRYPDWFLIIYWESSQKSMDRYRSLMKMCSRKEAPMVEPNHTECSSESESADTVSTHPHPGFEVLRFYPSTVVYSFWKRKYWDESDREYGQKCLVNMTQSIDRVRVEQFASWLEHQGKDATEFREYWEDRKTLEKNALLTDSVPQAEEDVIKTVTKMGKKLVCLLIYLSDCLVSGQKFTISGLAKCFRLTENIDKESSDLYEIFSAVIGSETPSAKFTSAMEEYTKVFQDFMETPTFEFARLPKMVYDVKNKAKEFLNWYNGMTKEQKMKITALYALYISVNTRIQNYFQNDIKDMNRQEPFVVLLQGIGGIGKTQLAKHLARRVCKDVLKIYPKDNIAQITPDDKYWPPFGGQEVAIFDDAGSHQDFEKDLLFKNIKGICSPALFNAAGAGVEHKLNPINFKVIIATTNTEFHEIASRVAQMYDVNSVGAFSRRMLTIQCEWNNNYGQFHQDEPWLNKIDELNCSHINMKRWRFKDGKFEKVGPIALDALMEEIRIREQHFNKDFTNWQLRVAGRREAKLGQSHYSIVFHGRAGQGKSTMADSLALNLSDVLKYPLIRCGDIREVQKLRPRTRIILQLEDVLRYTMSVDDENVLMTLYNDVLKPGSVLIWTTNISPKLVRPTFSKLGIAWQRSLPFLNEGLTRRIGFSGYFNGTIQPTNACEIFVSNMRYYRFLCNRTIVGADLMENLCRTVLYVVISIVTVGIFPLVYYYATQSASYEELQGSEIDQYVYSQYLTYLKRSQEIQVECKPIVRRDDYNLMIDCIDSEKFMRIKNVSEVDAHLFFDQESYHSNDPEWKIFLPTSVCREMQTNLERYLLPKYNFDTTSVCELIKRFVLAFNAVGIEPIFYANFHDIGEFEYRDGKLIMQVPEVDALNPFACVSPKPRIVEEDGVVKIHFGTKIFSASRVLGLSIDDLMLLDLTYDEAYQLSTFSVSDVFTQHPSVLRMIRDKAVSDVVTQVASNTKRLKDRVLAFSKTPLGIVTMILIAVFASMALLKLLYSLFSKTDKDLESKKKGRKGSPKARKYDSDDDKRREDRSASDTEDDADLDRNAKKKGRKGSPKTRKYDSDDDRRESKKKGRKGSPKTRKYDSDDDRVREDVLTLKDMNAFDANKPYFNVAFQAARKNLCQIYERISDETILNEEPEGQACYGMFVQTRVLVTVGHITINANSKTNFYVGSDEFQGFHKMKLVKRYAERDLSVWYVPSLKQMNYSAKSLKSFLLSQKLIQWDNEWNGILQRFGANKREEFHSNVLDFNEGPDTFTNNGTLRNWAAAYFAGFGIKVTTYGDCGLPYYLCEPQPILCNKIIGIHCMGNKMGSQTTGVLSIITREDYEHWEDLYKTHYEKETLSCKFCEHQEMTIEKDTNPKVHGHENVWHTEHLATWQTFVEEFKFYLRLNPDFVGGVIKNVGELYGTVRHSHLQFLPNDMNVCNEDIGPWKQIDASTIKQGVAGVAKVCTVEIKSDGLQKYIKKCQKLGPDFRIRAIRFKSAKLGYCIRLTITVLINEEEVEKQTQQQLTNIVCTEERDTLVAFPSQIGAPIHVHPAVYAVLDGAVRNKERGKLEDVPFSSVPDNETVKVIGSFCQSKSHIPNNNYTLSPFSRLVEDIIPIEKKPCVYDQALIPPEELANIPLNNYGQPCPRAGLSVLWAHKKYSNPVVLREVSKQYATKIRTYYANLRILSDHEVLHGLGNSYAEGNISGLELDTSIGFTMKELFYVSKKSDVIGLTEAGQYYWHNNEAAVFLRQMYEDAKVHSTRGEKYCSIFTELLKMEKLKLAKIYRGRTFVAQDVLGVLMERRNLGMICSRAMTRDPTCGIGTDPVKDFNRHFEYLNHFPNIWAGDYSNFDRNTPAAIQQEITNLLMQVNPQIANEIKSTMSTNIERLQVSGTTLMEVHGGLPSGCFGTAPFNCLNNDYLLYYCFYLLSLEDELEWSWKAYTDNVRRLFYGDDVIVSVSNDYAKCFTRERVSKIMKSDLGMTLDSSAKDGTTSVFDTWETASWISRFFRKVGKYPFTVGALKKISIGANFHYVSSVSLSHLGSLMEKAQWEAAFWEKEYFDRITEAIRRCVEQQPKLLKFVQIESQDSIHERAFHLALPGMYFDYQGNKIIPQNQIGASRPIEDWASEVEEEGALENAPQVAINNNLIIRETKNKSFFKLYLFPKTYVKKVIQKIMNGQVNEDMLEKLTGAFSQQLNDYFQKGIITKVTSIYTKTGPDNDVIWTCKLACTKISTLTPLTTTGSGKTKGEAKEEAAHEMIIAIDWQEHPRLPEKKSLTLKKSKTERNLLLLTSVPEMNVSAGVVGKTPGAPMAAQDVSVVTDSGLYTNTMAPSPAKILNSTAIALDNPAGSGAPFDKKTSVYNIYQRWESKNTTISPALASGTEILRISLDPADLPPAIKSYVDFHDTLVPALDIVIAIAGAQGTIGWISTGWVKDASNSKKYTLADLQQVSMEESNMNGTQIIRISLNDVRRSGLFRLREKDPEPYPGIIMMVDHAVTNVQRNDSVNYPVRVQVRLAPNCILMEPFNTPSGGSSSIDFNLGSYFYDDSLDLLIGSSATTNSLTTEISNPDYGFQTKDFKPTFEKATVAGLYYNVDKDVSAYFPVVTTDPTASADLLKAARNLSPLPVHSATLDNLLPEMVVFAFGDVPKLDKAALGVKPTLVGTVYNIPKRSINLFGIIKYDITTITVCDGGCYIEAVVDCTKETTVKPNLLVYNGCDTDQIIQDDLVMGPRPNPQRDIPITWIHKIDAATLTVVGEDFNVSTYVPDRTLDRILMTESYNIDLSRAVYVQTGNTIPATNLPTGLKQVSFVRTGTTTTVQSDLPFCPLYKPILRNATKALAQLAEQKQLGKIVKGDLYVDNFNLGQIGFTDGVFFVRTDSFRLLRANIGDNVFIKNITSLPSVQGLAAYNTTGMNSWISSSLTKLSRPKLDLSAFVCESMSMAGGAIEGLGSGISAWANQTFQRQMMDQMFQNNAALQGANNAAIAARQKAAFERNLELTGYNSTSAQFGLGGGARPKVGPQTEDQLNTIPYDRSSQFVYSHTFTPTSKSDKDVETDSDDDEPTHVVGTTQADVHAPADIPTADVPAVKKDVTTFTPNPIYVPPNHPGLRNVAFPVNTEAMDAALTKTIAQNMPSVVHYNMTPTDVSQA